MPPSPASSLAYSAVALLTSLLVIIQLPVHFEPKKSSNWLFIVWISLSMLNYSINAIIWNDNVINYAPVWCDISSNVIMVSRLGVQLSLLCIARRLHGMVNGNVVHMSAREERRKMFWDIFIAIVIPILFLPLTYVVEGQDFELVEQIGCYPAVERTIPAMLLVMIWPPIFALVTAVYSALIMFMILRQRARMHEFEDFGNKVDSYHWRLIFLASAQIVLLLPWTIFVVVWDAVSGTMFPYNWDNIHVNFSQAPQYLASVWSVNAENVVGYELFDRWIYVAYSFLFLALFGWTERSRNHYKRHYGRAFLAAMSLFGYRSSSSDIHEARRDLESPPPACRRKFPSFVTSFSTSFIASRFTSSETRTIASYHTSIASDEIVSGPRVPSPARTLTNILHEHEKDQTDLVYPSSLPPPRIATAVTLTHASGAVAPTQYIVKPKPAFLAHHHQT